MTSSTTKEIHVLLFVTSLITKKIHVSLVFVVDVNNDTCWVCCFLFETLVL